MPRTQSSPRINKGLALTPELLIEVSAQTSLNQIFSPNTAGGMLLSDSPFTDPTLDFSLTTRSFQKWKPWKM